MTRIVLVSLAALLVPGLTGCEFPGQPKERDRPVPANKVVDFNSLYATHCSGCHGADGRLGPAPPLNDPLFLAVVPDDQLLQVIREGRRVTPQDPTTGKHPEGQKTPMPAFAEDLGGPLTREQVEALARGIKPRWGAAAIQRTGLPPYLGGPGDARAGARVFATACASCHGDEGRGKPVGAGAVHLHAFLATISDKALRRLVITGRPDLGMPAYDDGKGRPAEFHTLTSGQIDDVVALLGEWRQGKSVDGK